VSYEQLPSDHISVPSTGKPECLLTWIARPEGGIRLYASRNLADTAWGQRSDLTRPTVDWHLGVMMADVLIVDRATPAEAIQWVLERWMREDAERERKAIEYARPGLVINDPAALTRGAGTSGI
jgi:hypothetical protein